MKKFRRFFIKDKYGIVRSCIAMCALLLLCMALTMYIHGQNNIQDHARLAGSMASRAGARFDQVLDDAYLQVQAAAENLVHAEEGDQAAVDSALDQLADGGCFSHVSLEEADGVMDGFIINAADSMLEVRYPISDGRELVAAADPDDLHRLLADGTEDGIEYEIYNAKTGSCLLSDGGHAGESYYDALLNLTDAGQLEEIISADAGDARVVRVHKDGEYQFIAMAGSRHIDCGISLQIPEDLLDEEGISALHLLIPGVVLLLMGWCIASSCVTLRRIRNSNRNATYALKMSDHMMESAARDGRITLLVVSWKRDGIFACHDGLGLTSASQSIRSISDLEHVCCMDDGEMDRVYECLNTLAENATAELTVHCYTASREARLLRINFHRMESKEKNFLCSISDCTHEKAAQYRAEQEMMYMENARRRTSSVWQVNVSRNRWQALHIREDDPLFRLNAQQGVWRDYSSDLGGVLSEHIHPADYPAYAEFAGIPAMASAFRTGMAEFTRDYRVVAGEGSYEWHRMHVRLWQDPKASDIMANLYIYNVDAKKNAELERGERKRILQQSMTAMSGIYSGLYYVDLDNDLCYTARSLGGDLADQLSMPYKATFDHYISTAVHPEDRDKLRSLIGAYSLKRSMSEGSHFRSCHYRRRVGDDSYAKTTIILQPARFENGSVKEIALAIRYADYEAE